MVVGCKSRCEQLCDRTVECLPSEVNKLIPDFIGIECRWDHGAKAADSRCLSACRTEYEKVPYGMEDEVNRCLDCRLDAGGDIGEGCSNYDAMYETCEEPCDEPEVEAFIEGFRSEADLMSDLDCD